MITIKDLNVWVEPKCLTWQDGDYVRHPLIDLQETAEHLLQRIEEAGNSRSD